MLDSELVKLSDSFGAYNEYIEGEDTINGQTFDLLTAALGLESSAYSDADCIGIVENIIQNYHLWHKIEAGEGNLYICSDCGLEYALSAGRVSQDSPSHESFVCDLCAGEGK